MDTISQNQIYGIADDISCVCNGLINQTEYQIELYIETQNGYFYVLEPVNFDVNYAVNFLNEFQDRLCFGTDICYPTQQLPLAGFLLDLKKSGRISAEVFEKIARGNIKRLLNI